MRRNILGRAVPVALAVLAAMGAASCSGSDDVLFPRGLVAAFVADEPIQDGSVGLLAGSPPFVTLRVRVAARGIDDFFGAGFEISYDPDVLRLVRWDDADSFLRDGGAEADFIVDAVSQPGRVIVGASRRQDAGHTVPGVNVVGTRTLLTLVFKPKKASKASPVQFVTSPPGTCEARDSSLPPPGRAIPVLWKGGNVSVTSS